MSSQLEPNECPICLDPIVGKDSVGIVQKCGHIYHEMCITTWSSHSNSCPTCRRLFYKIEFATLETPSKITKSISVQDKLAPNDAINEIPSEFIRNENTPGNERVSTPIIDGTCSICTSSQYQPSLRMVNCTSCLSHFHLRCLGITSGSQETWYCPICDNILDIRQIDDSRGSSNRRRPVQRRIPSLRSPRTSTLSETPSSSSSNSRITDVVFRNPAAASSLYSGPLTSSISFQQFGDSTPLTSSHRSKPTGLVIFNNNNELDDEFLEEIDESEEPIQSSVINGGILLRRELRERQHLSQEEAKSWDILNSVRGTTPIGGHDDINQVQNDERVKEESPQGIVPERRRRRRTKMELKSGINTTTSLQPSIPTSTSTTASSTISSSPSTSSSSSISTSTPSRISILINQMKTSNRPRGYGLSSNHQPPQLSESHSPSDGSPMALSPITVDSDSLSEEEDLLRKRTCQKLEPKPLIRELTLEQKREIQGHLRTHLRPLYKPGAQPEKMQNNFITSEKEYIDINKNISRQIYKHILSLESPIDVFSDKDHLHRIIDGFVSKIVN
ncbi:hypothetical protein CAAN1_29S00518 [[Candida] anglica]|uniref:RING-type domain-containing protein n=1 Tax=[Candida] anglica TaxID=148631 RepID=A0ABP0EBQ4_9ASCO